MVVVMFFHACPAMPSRLATWRAVSLLPFFLFPHVQGMISEGYLPTGKDMTWAWYAGKFCFDYKRAMQTVSGEVEFQVDGVVNEGSHPLMRSPSDEPPCWGTCQTPGNWYWMVFDDEQEHWKTIRNRWDYASCEEMFKYASSVEKLDLQPPVGGPVGKPQWSKTFQIGEHIRPRFWYFTVVACNVTSVDPVHFRIHAKNVQSAMQQEFGVDQHNMLLLQFFAAISFTALAIVAHKGVRNKVGSSDVYRTRPMLRLLVLSLACTVLQSAGYTLHYLVYSFNGVGLPGLEVFSTFSGAISKSILSAIFFLIASGWALLTAPQKEAQRRWFFGGLAVIVLVSVACEIQGLYFHDTSTTLYLYESGSGTLVLFLNCMLFVGSLAAMYETFLREEVEELRQFYMFVTVAYSVFYLMLPVTVLVAYLLAPWVRFKIVARIEVASRLFTFIALLFCFWPSRLDMLLRTRLEEHGMALRNADENWDQELAGCGEIDTSRGAEEDAVE